jgi:predicted nucleic acid-binding protein
MAVRYSSSEIGSLAQKPIFFDTNIILYLFWPSGSQPWENSYASIFGSLLRQGNDMFVDFIVISEVINRAVRIEYEKHLQANNFSKISLPFKQFRNNPDGQSVLNDIYQTIQGKILNRFQISGKIFRQSDIEKFLQTDSLDFSDKGIISICNDNDFVLLTNDKDFSNSNLDILTVNPAILKST